MESREIEIEVNFKVPIREIPEVHRLEAERLAREVYVMTLLRHGDISSGRAGKMLGIPRVEVFDLMSSYDISPFDDTLTQEDLERQVAQARRLLEKYKQ